MNPELIGMTNLVSQLALGVPCHCLLSSVRLTGRSPHPADICIGAGDLKASLVLIIFLASALITELFPQPQFSGILRHDLSV